MARSELSSEEEAQCSRDSDIRQRDYAENEVDEPLMYSQFRRVFRTIKRVSYRNLLVDLDPRIILHARELDTYTPGI